MLKEKFTVPEAAKATSKSETWIRNAAKSGRVKAEQYGREWLLTPEEVERLSREYPLAEGA